MSIPESDELGEDLAQPEDDPEYVFELEAVDDFDGSAFLWATR